MITGLKDHEDTCSPCPVGTFAGGLLSPFVKNDQYLHVTVEGAVECSPCPLNHFAPSEHSAACQTCAPTLYALPGSRRCSTRPTCTQGDYYHYFSTYQRAFPLGCLLCFFWGLVADV